VDWPKAAKDKTLGVEWNFTRNLQTLVLVHFCFGGIEGRLVWPHLPREDNLLAILRIDGAAEVSIFANGTLSSQDSTISMHPYSLKIVAPFSAHLR
jgi:hypothetical protein